MYGRGAMTERQKAISNLRRWLNDPVAFVREVFKAEPDEWQKEALEDFRNTKRISLKASKGVGKSTTLSWMIWNFLLTRPHPKIAVTSISGDNLADGLWSELSLWYGKSPMLQAMFTVTKTKIFAKENPETWFCSARNWSKSADKSQQALTLAGLHADYILFVIDEVGGIPDSIVATAEAALAGGKESKLVMAGNTVMASGPLWRAATSERNLWKVVTINSDPDNPKRSPRVSIQWAREQIEKYGRDSDYVKVNVFGEFPSQSINALLGVEEVETAMSRAYKIEDFDHAQKRLGIDVARFGDDDTVIFPRQGLMAYQPVIMKNARTNEIAARVMAAKAKWNAEVEFIDGSGGFGAGTVDALIQAGHAPQEIHFSSRPTDPRFFNKRSEMWWNMAEWIKRGGALPKIPELIKELTTPEYFYQNGKLRLEEKDSIKERLGKSPDMADALALTFAHPEMPTKLGELGLAHQFMEKSQHKVEYDPFA
jgi:phage terminase large subunit